MDCQTQTLLPLLTPFCQNAQGSSPELHGLWSDQGDEPSLAEARVKKRTKGLALLYHQRFLKKS